MRRRSHQLPHRWSDKLTHRAHTGELSSRRWHEDPRRREVRGPHAWVRPSPIRNPARERWRYSCRSLITSPSAVEFNSRHSSLGRSLRGSMATAHLWHEGGLSAKSSEIFSDSAADPLDIGTKTWLMWLYTNEHRPQRRTTMKTTKTIAGLTYDQANELLAAFNNGTTSRTDQAKPLPTPPNRCNPCPERVARCPRRTNSIPN